jgi:hypothetical protein
MRLFAAQYRLFERGFDLRLGSRVGRRLERRAQLLGNVSLFLTDFRFSRYRGNVAAVHKGPSIEKMRCS